MSIRGIIKRGPYLRLDSVSLFSAFLFVGVPDISRISVVFSNLAADQVEGYNCFGKLVTTGGRGRDTI